MAVYQLLKLRMLEFYQDFSDKYVHRHDFELCYVDTDLYYLALSGSGLDDLIKPELKTAYDLDNRNWLVTDEYTKRTPGLKLLL